MLYVLYYIVLYVLQVSATRYQIKILRLRFLVYRVQGTACGHGWTTSDKKKKKENSA
jgi:hypothetical protein